MSNVNGNFNDLNIKGNINIGNNINFNADGSYSLRGSGNFGIINSQQIYSTQGFILGSGNNLSVPGAKVLGISKDGQSILGGLTILKPSSLTSMGYPISGNLIFEAPKSNNGILFNDGSFLSSGTNFDNININGNINGNVANLTSINLSGNINSGIRSVANFNTINCLNNANFGSITSNNFIGNTGSRINVDTGNFKSLNVTGNYMINNLSTITIRSGDSIYGNNLIITGNTIFNSKGNNIISTQINGNKINTGSIIFSDDSILNRAPGLTVSGNIQNNWTVSGNTPNAGISLDSGTWLVTFNIYFTSTTSAINYVYGSGSGNSIFGLVALAGTTNWSSTGTYIFTTTIPAIIYLYSFKPANIDVYKSTHVAIRIV